MELTHNRLLVMQLMYDEFAASGVWPVVDWVEDELRDEDIDVWREVRELPESWGTHGTINAHPEFQNHRFGLSIEGLVALGTASRALNLFVSAVRQMAAVEAAAPRERHRPVTPKFTHEDAREVIRGSNDVKLLIVLELINQEWHLRGGGSGPGEDADGVPVPPITWSIDVKQEVRHYAYVRNAADYLRIRSGRQAARTPFAGTPGAPPRSRRQRAWDRWDRAMDHRGWSTLDKTNRNLGLLGGIGTVGTAVVIVGIVRDWF